MLVTFANVLLRKARNTQNSRQFLLDFIDSKFDIVNNQGAQIVSTTVNGKSMSLQVPSGMGLAQILGAAELALSALEKGLDYVPRSTFATVRGVSGGYN